MTVRSPRLLERYNRKRRFDVTDEPRGTLARKAGRSFVIQKHDATRLHYDFRLELDGVLRSWAVPKGPSLSPGDKRLAMEVEDHPVSYRDFEGVIPEGEYGAGPVIVWDRGTWEPLEDPHKALGKGALRFELRGEKLRGQFSLVRLRRGAKEHGKPWLLIKRSDDFVREGEEAEVTRRRPESVLSGRTVEEVARGARQARATRGRRRRRLPGRGTAGATRRGRRDSVEGLGIGGVRITHPERVMDGASGVTKAELARYVEAVSGLLLPYAVQRPLALVRCPQGNTHQCFFQKQAAAGFSEAIGRRTIEQREVIYLTRSRGLLELVQFNAMEIHGWGARLPDWQHPDWIVFDLDPDVDLPFARVVDAAFEMRGLLAGLGLQSYVKTTGGKGLHVVAPLAPRLDWDRIRTFTRGIAEEMARRKPSAYLASVSKQLRRGRIFIDYLRNARQATAVLPYSPRARPGATVAMPVAWKDLKHVDPREFDVRSVPALLKKRRRDPWADFLSQKQDLSEKLGIGTEN